MTTVAGPSTTALLRPRYEGANIRTWIGFKHFMYLAEEAVVQWFRERGLGPQRLYHEHGLGLSVVDSSVQLPAVLEIDDPVDAEVTGGPGTFKVRLVARREGSPVVLRGTLAVAAVPEPEAPVPEPDGPAAARPPEELAAIVAPGQAPAPARHRSDRRLQPAGDAAAVLAPEGSGSFVWSWRVPYYYCHFSRRVQCSGYVRALEEVVDRFLAARGISVGTMLERRGWIPVVSRARVSLLADAAMEEPMHTVLTVTDVLRGMAFDARMDCYVERGDELVHCATGRILQGYAVARGEGAGGLAVLDEGTVAALGPVGAA